MRLLILILTAAMIIFAPHAFAADAPVVKNGCIEMPGVEASSITLPYTVRFFRAVRGDNDRPVYIGSAGQGRDYIVEYAPYGGTLAPDGALRLSTLAEKTEADHRSMNVHYEKLPTGETLLVGFVMNPAGTEVRIVKKVPNGLSGTDDRLMKLLESFGADIWPALAGATGAPCP